MKKLSLSLISLLLLLAFVACGEPLDLSGLSPTDLFSSTTTTEATEPTETTTTTSDEGTSSTTQNGGNNATPPSTSTTSNTIDQLPEREPSTASLYTVSQVTGGVCVDAYLGSETTVVIPDTISGKSVVAIADNVFKDRTTLTAVVIPDTVTAIGANAFSGCSNLKRADLPSALKTLGASAFNGCAKLPFAYLSSTVTSVGASAFAGCSELVLAMAGSGTSFPSNYKDADTTVYTGISASNYGVTDSGLHYAVVGSSVTILRYQFTNTGVVSIPSKLLNKTVATIGEKAFYRSTELTQVTIPSGVVSIKPKAFSGCVNVSKMSFNATACTDVVYADETTLDLGKNTPNGMALKFGNNVTKIPNYLFKYCKNISSLTIGTAVTSIPSDAFTGCTKLATIYFNAANCADFVKNHTTFALDSTSESGAAERSIIFGETVKRVPAYIMSGIPQLVKVSFANPENSECISIGSFAFANCAYLKDVELPTSGTLKTIENNAFEKSPYTTMVVPNGVTTIGANAFYSLKTTGMLEYVILPSTITSISEMMINRVADTFTGIFFEGTQSAWTALTSSLPTTDPLLKLTVYYSGQWSLVDGVPTAN